MDDDFHTQEKKMDLYVELVDDLQIKTKEYLQPNPTVRAKMAAVKVTLYKYLKYVLLLILSCRVFPSYQARPRQAPTLNQRVH